MLLIVCRLVWTRAMSSRCSDVMGEWVWGSFGGRIGRFSTFSTFGINLAVVDRISKAVVAVDDVGELDTMPDGDSGENPVLYSKFRLLYKLS